MIVKKKSFTLLFLAITAHAAEQSNFQHAPEQKYPAGLKFIPVQEVISTLEPAPQLIEENLNAILSSDNGTASLLKALPKADSIIRSVEGNYRLYISGLNARRKNILSSVGYDPYMKQTHPTQFSDYNGPVIHHCTMAIMQRIIKEAQSKTVKAVPTWLYHIPGKPLELDDENYLLIQATNFLTQFQSLENLNETEKSKFIKELDMADFYNVIRSIHWAFPNENTIYVNTDTHKIVLPTTLSPDNEGLGLNAKYGKAILGQSLSKAKHNVRNWYDGGHKAFEESIVKKYGDTEDLAEWNECYQNDIDVHN